MYLLRMHTYWNLYTNFPTRSDYLSKYHFYFSRSVTFNVQLHARLLVTGWLACNRVNAFEDIHWKEWLKSGSRLIARQWIEGLPNGNYLRHNIVQKRDSILTYH